MESNSFESKYSNGSAWHARAGELADWFLLHLVNRRDVCGGYYEGGQVTRRVKVTHALLSRHCRALDASNLIGLHTAGPDNLSLGGALDIDAHGDDPARADANFHAALHWYTALVRMALHPLLTASNGRGGFHVRVLLAEAIDAARLFLFFRQLTADHRKVGLDQRPEQFPKQSDVRKCAKGLGNWIRLPGRHHKRDYWSEIWNGTRWLAGHDAIDFLLSLTGDDPALIPAASEAPPTPRQPLRPVTTQRRSSPLMAEFLGQRAGAYIDKLPAGKTVGEGRDGDGFRLACFLVHDLALSDHEALKWLEIWDSRNASAKGTERLGQLIANAHRYGKHIYTHQTQTRNNHRA
jgi:hypothetical protein